jgi:electron transfer flavoprotein-quinone oxidoreductase
LNGLFSSFWSQVPLERHVFKKTLSFLTPSSSVNLQFETANFDQPPYNGYTIMRPVFDRWLADQVVNQGASLFCNCSAENLIQTEDRIAGVTVKGREGELRSDIVIAADGVLSFLAQQAGLRKEIQPGQMGLGIKLLLGTPREVINERFGLEKDQGADYALLGITGGVWGGGFLYTNQDSLSFGLVVHLDSLRAAGKTPYDLLNQALEQPQIKKLVKGGTPLEYSAHLVPEGGIKGIPRLHTAGMLVVGDAAGLCYSNGINLEGINLAITSGEIAAECIIEAIRAKDCSSEKLSQYKRKLDASFVMRDMKTFGKAVGMMHIDRLFQIYPELACSIFEKIYRVEGVPRDKVLKLIRKEMKGKVGTLDAVAYGIKIGRALL